jgi:hypothetical protein
MKNTSNTSATELPAIAGGSTPIANLVRLLARQAALEAVAKHRHVSAPARQAPEPHS